jgi:hypothetical protein
MSKVGVARASGSRHGAWLAAAVVFACACGDRALQLTPPMPDPTGHVTGWPDVINRNVDILFLIDDSPEMRMAQANLVQSFPTFMTTLASAPGGPPNVHIAVVSSDLGAGDGSIAGCDAQGGRRGVFQYTPRGTCTDTGLQPGATFISNIAGQANYTGTLADTFACIAALGENGCGFEHQFGAILRALGADGEPPPIENEGFLRPDAYLYIVMFTNEDDCSAVTGGQLYDTANNANMASPLGPPLNFRCNEFGHLCERAGGALMHPDRNAPGLDVSATVTYDSCVSDDTEVYLLGAKQTADRLKALKSDPSQLIVAAITGAPTPYTVRWTPPLIGVDSSCGAASCPWPEMTHACATDMGTADPAVRISRFVEQFGSNGQMLSICDASFAPALDRIAQQINARLNH